MKNYEEIINSSSVVLVEFYATWCPHCQRMMPRVADIKEKLTGKVNVYQFDIDKNTELDKEEDIETIPTFIIYKDGKEEWRYSGEMEECILLSTIESYL